MLLLTALVLLLTVPGSAHSGRTDSQGGHYVSATGEYHFHHGYGPHQHVDGVCPYSSSVSSSSSTTTTSSSLTVDTSSASWASGYMDGHIDGYEYGYEEGYDEGYEDGYDEGGMKRYTEGYKNGANVAKKSGYSEGYDVGYDVGYDEGVNAGEKDGRTTGYDTGKTEGYEEGYGVGVTTADERNKIIVAVCAAIVLIMAAVTGSKFRKIKKLEKAAHDAQADIAQQLQLVTKQLQEARNLYGDLEHIYYSESPRYPWLAKQLADYSYLCDLKAAQELRTKARPAIKAADKLTAIAAEKRELQRKLKEAEYMLSVYQHLYPELPQLLAEHQDEQDQSAQS